MKFNFDSSRPFVLIITAIGVKSPNKINQSTIGLTIMPSKNPKRVHSLFIGRRASLFIKVIAKNIKDNVVNAYADIVSAVLKK